MKNKSSDKVRPKKFLGQHFLHDQHIARKIVEALKLDGENNHVLEIGPGMGVLTKFLLENSAINLSVVEIDRESVQYLHDHYPQLHGRILSGDFLQMNIDGIADKLHIIGNFPYNISSQIFFKILDSKSVVDQVVCMLQKEVADRIAAKHGNKTYGILSVLLQAYYDIDMLFKVSPGVFTPPPNVMSAVIRLRRNNVVSLPCDEKFFIQVVKQGFNNRRKTLRNALKSLNLAKEIIALEILDKRAEQLSVTSFVELTQAIEQSRGRAID